MAESTPLPPNLFVFDSAPESSREFDVSDPEVVAMLEESQQSHFWFAARNRQILDFLRRDGLTPPRRILEVGCGTGTVLAALVGAGYEMAGVEMHPRLARLAAASNPANRIYSLDIEAPPTEFLRLAPFDGVGLFDVVEHIARPETLLRACAALVRPGGLLIGTVPALQALWSDYDSFGGHRLRYDRRLIRSLFQRAGLPAPRVSYFFQSLLPGILIQRMVIGRNRGSGDARRRVAQHLALDAPGPILNRVFAGVSAAERLLRRALPLGRVPGPSLWFSTRILDPDAVRSETRPRGRTDDRR